MGRTSTEDGPRHEEEIGHEKAQKILRKVRHRLTRIFLDRITGFTQIYFTAENAKVT
jgi:hypothetical protein